MPRNFGGKDLPIAIKHVHLSHAVDIATSSERESSILHLARQALVQPSTDREAPFPQSFRRERPIHQSYMSTPVDDLAAELFAITLTDNEVDSDSHHKLWASRSEVQRDKGKAYLDAELTVNDT